MPNAELSGSVRLGIKCEACPDWSCPANECERAWATCYVPPFGKLFSTGIFHWISISCCWNRTLARLLSQDNSGNVIFRKPLLSEQHTISETRTWHADCYYISWNTPTGKKMVLLQETAISKHWHQKTTGHWSLLCGTDNKFFLEQYFYLRLINLRKHAEVLFLFLWHITQS